MTIAHWWPKLSPSTQHRLIQNNGDTLPPHLVTEIAQAGGPTTSDSWWVGQGGLSGLSFPDDAIDWIEAVGNDEAPEVS